MERAHAAETFPLKTIQSLPHPSTYLYTFIKLELPFFRSSGPHNLINNKLSRPLNVSTNLQSSTFFPTAFQSSHNPLPTTTPAPVPDMARIISSVASVESLHNPTQQIPEKTYPTQSAGPHFPSHPISAPLLRIIPGNPRFATAPLQWLSTPPSGRPYILEASISTDKDIVAEITLPQGDNPIPEQWFEFSINSGKAGSNGIFIEFNLRAGAVRAKCVCLTEEFTGGIGIANRALLDDKGLPVAILSLDYLNCTSHKLGNNGKLVPFIPRFAGHRGMGSSGTNAPWRLLENSVESFLSATLPDTPCKTIELDVQVTKDNKLVVFHDWYIRPRDQTGHVLYDRNSVRVPLYNMTFDQLDKLYRQNYTHHARTMGQVVEKRKEVRSLAMKEHEIEEEAFDVQLRSLREVCDTLPEEIGMLVELKYPPPNVSNGQIPYPEKNFYVDLVLNDLVACSRNANRKIAFLSFDADLCLLLKKKQTRFPVYFSHCDTMDKPCEEFDPRCIDIFEGLRYVRSQKMDGLMLFNQLVDERPEAIGEILKANIPMLTYGKKNCSEIFVRKQFGMGVSGVIADDVDLLLESLSGE